MVEKMDFADNYPFFRLLLYIIDILVTDLNSCILTFKSIL